MRHPRSILQIAGIVLLYLFLFLGGLWHLLGRYETVMSFSAGPVLIVLSLITWFTYRRTLPTSDARLRLDIVSVNIFIAGFLVEALGVRTGFPFGGYAYGTTLQPSIGHVPLAIGFAWLGVLLSSHAISQRIAERLHLKHPGWTILLTGSLMLLFDIIMEPAAVRLHYWTWDGGAIPLQNYLSWWLLGMAFTTFGMWVGALRARVPGIAVHLYLAQLLYFGISLIPPH